MSHLASLPAIRSSKSDFWRRLLFGPRTVLGTFQDVLFGIFAPLLCFAFDPGVMFGGLTVAGLSMIALLVLLVLGGRWRKFDAVLAGILFAGAAVSFAVALCPLPASMMGLLFVVGALCFLPFFTAIVCLRNAVRTLASPPVRIHRRLAAGTTLAVLLLAAAYQVAADRGSAAPRVRPGQRGRRPIGAIRDRLSKRHRREPVAVRERLTVPTLQGLPLS
jgi:hypothetical protein